MILVVGGGGTLGRLVIGRLLAAGERVRVMARTPRSVDALRAGGAEIVPGDLLDRDSLSRACAGADAVVAAAHSMLGRGRNASAHVDGEGHRQLFDAARAAGVRRVIYTSVYDYGEVYRSVPFFRIKMEVERYLEATGLAYTILRPTAFMEHHAHMLIGAPILAGRTVVLFGRGERPRNFVAADDVAEIVELALRNATIVGETVEVVGPENASNMDVVRLYERIAGKRARVRHIPPAIAGAMAPVVRPLHPGIAQILQIGALADVADEAVDIARLTGRLPRRMTRLEEWVSRHLAAVAAVS